MSRIIVAFPDREFNRKVASVLEASGYEVYRVCLTGSEAMRAFALCQDGVLICGARFPDRTADQLAWDLGERAVILVVARAEQLAQCEHPQIFRRKLPMNRSELLSAVDMLLQVHDHRMPHRGEEQQKVINQAKACIQQEMGMTEPEAHQALQRYAMRHGMKIMECARMVLEGNINNITS